MNAAHPTPPAPGYLTKRVAAGYLSLSERSLDYARQRGEVPFFRVGARVLFKREDLDRWMQRKRIAISKRARRRAAWCSRRD